MAAVTPSGYESDELPATGMHTGSEAGEPGERGPVEPGDLFAMAAEDDAALPPGSSPEVGEGGSQDDGLAPDFREP